MDARYEFLFDKGFPLVINDTFMAGVVRRCAEATVGETWSSASTQSAPLSSISFFIDKYHRIWNKYFNVDKYTKGLWNKSHNSYKIDEEDAREREPYLKQERKKNIWGIVLKDFSNICNGMNFYPGCRWGCFFIFELFSTCVKLLKIITTEQIRRVWAEKTKSIVTFHADV